MPDEPKQTEKAATHKKQLAEGILQDRYHFRFNIIKAICEYRPRGEDRFHPVNDYIENSILRELLNQDGIYLKITDLRQLLESDFSDPYDPFKSYFEALPKWDDQDHIRDLAECVKTRTPVIFYNYLRKWLIATVANVLIKENCQNHTCLTLTGGQGKFKTTFLDHFTPPALVEYTFTGKLDPNSKDSMTLLAECFIINIDDQLRQLNKKDENDLKELITKPFCKYRKPYGHNVEKYPRAASFCASVNGNDFLTDPTGNRRFLPFEVLNIDINAALKIDMDLVYAQAYYLFKKGERYWFNDAEIEELAQHNRDFQVMSDEEQLIIDYFDLPENDTQATHFYQPAGIKEYLELMSKQRLSTRKLGEALTKLGFEKKRRVQGRGFYPYTYAVIQKTQIEIERDRGNAKAPIINTINSYITEPATPF